MTHDQGGDGGLEPRVARLEGDVVHLCSHVRPLTEAVAGLTERVSDLRVEFADVRAGIDRMPDKEFVVKLVAAACALLAAISPFHDRLAHLVT